MNTIKLQDAVEAHLNRLRAIKAGIMGLGEQNSTEARSGLMDIIEESERRLREDVDRYTGVI